MCLVVYVCVSVGHSVRVCDGVLVICVHVRVFASGHVRISGYMNVSWHVYVFYVSVFVIMCICVCVHV